MTDTYEKCSCGSRQKSKCVKESGLGAGKMCLKTEDSLYINFRETLNGGFCAAIDYESDAWQKVLSDWEGFKIEDPLHLSFFKSEDEYWLSQNDRIDVQLTKECVPFIKVK